MYLCISINYFCFVCFSGCNSLIIIFTLQQKVKEELLQHEIQLEDFGGEIPSVEISALKVN